MTESEDNNSMDADSNDSKDSLQQNPTYLLFIDIYFTISKLLFELQDIGFTGAIRQ